MPLGAFGCIWVHSGVFRCIWLHSGAFGCLRVALRCICVHSCAFGFILVHLGAFEGAFMCIWMPLGAFGCLLGALGCIRVHSGSLGLILVDLGDLGYRVLNLENETNKQRTPWMSRDPIRSNNRRVFFLLGGSLREVLKKNMSFYLHFVDKRLNPC